MKCKFIMDGQKKMSYIPHPYTSIWLILPGSSCLNLPCFRNSGKHNRRNMICFHVRTPKQIPANSVMNMWGSGGIHFCDIHNTAMYIFLHQFNISTSSTAISSDIKEQKVQYWYHKWWHLGTINATGSSINHDAGSVTDGQNPGIN